jgi:hypothetical protein
MMRTPVLVLTFLGIALLVMAVVLFLLRENALYAIGYLGCGFFGGLALMTALVLALLGRRQP